ncbi:MAG: hypothetical protein NZ700_17725 [Gemmataceae bacterium]|nr:hypothetical protein [Gemmataceae bacterium]MDW8267426.1 hypothetical protein [Gemmataceae bacterium]
MTSWQHLDLIRLFDFYLAVAFLLSTYVRLGQYRAIGGLALNVPGRWPRLLDLVTRHRAVFLSWSTVWPVFAGFALMLLQLLASRLVWHQATLTLSTVASEPLLWPVLALLGAAMLSIDVYGIVVVNPIDRATLEHHFDRAEYWLRAWHGPLVRVLTFGRIDPHEMVSQEVRKALIDAGKLINSTMRWVIMQIALRIAFGLSLWLTYAVHDT